MNYRHAFHAGNFGDVLKHATLCLVLRALLRKDTPFAVLDTHAGIGSYDLAAEQARKTQEFRDGVAKVLSAGGKPSVIEPYIQAIKAANSANPGALRNYPGSPAIAAGMMRAQDRLYLNELHPDDYSLLRRHFAGDGRIQFRQMDGFTVAKALLPLAERRGVVIIDPAFEKDDELSRLAAAVKQGYKRFSTGVFLLWYPIKALSPVREFHRTLKSSGISRVLAAELLVRPARLADRLNGAGVILVNPPWQVDGELEALLPWLAKILKHESQGASSLQWLVPG